MTERLLQDIVLDVARIVLLVQSALKMQQSLNVVDCKVKMML